MPRGSASLLSTKIGGRASGYALPGRAWERVVANYQLPITNYQLPITNYQLPITKFKILEREYIDRTIRKIPKCDNKS
jgi:hypothetical protein